MMNSFRSFALKRYFPNLALPRRVPVTILRKGLPQKGMKYRKGNGNTEKKSERNERERKEESKRAEIPVPFTFQTRHCHGVPLFPY
jgi:hypothetical protein